MKRSEAIAWLDRLLKSKNEQVRQMAYNRLRELLMLLLRKMKIKSKFVKT